MNGTEPGRSEAAAIKHHNTTAFFGDLVLYLAVMFLVREIYFEQVGFIANGLFWSLSTLVVATWRMKARGVTWQELGLRRPRNFKKALLATGFILALTPAMLIIFEILKDQMPFLVTPDTSEASAGAKFGDLAGNWGRFALIIPFIWLESMLEEMLDRGFLINWLERVFARVPFATILAVVLQAAIFGFRHSYDLSDRSITVGLIGLVMGIAYVAWGRNLWPLMIAHCILNTLSMAGRVG